MPCLSVCLFNERKIQKKRNWRRIWRSYGPGVQMDQTSVCLLMFCSFSNPACLCYVQTLIWFAPLSSFVFSVLCKQECEILKVFQRHQSWSHGKTLPIKSHWQDKNVKHQQLSNINIIYAELCTDITWEVLHSCPLELTCCDCWCLKLFKHKCTDLSASF